MPARSSVPEADNKENYGSNPDPGESLLDQWYANYIDGTAKAGDDADNIQAEGDKVLYASKKPFSSDNKGGGGANNPPKKSGSRLCCGPRSVEVDDSIRPIERPNKGDQSAEKGGGGKFDSVQNDQDGDEDDADEDDDEEDEDDDDDDDEVSQTITEASVGDVASDVTNDHELGPEPPHPKLRKTSKKKGRKKENGEYVQEATSSSKKKGKYSVTPDVEQPMILAEKVGKSSALPPKRPTPQPGVSMETEMLASPQKRKGKKKKPLADTEMDILSVYESQIASLDGDLDETVTPLHSMGHMTYTKQPTLEDEEDLIENAEEERRKNKQRLREKKMREKEFSSPAKSHDQITVAYENAQKQIDSVLGPRGKQEEDSSKKKKDSPKKSPKKKKKEKEGDGKSSEDDKPNAGAEDKTDMPEEGEENLETARERMHQLLDDAFSLVSQSRTSLGNKVDPKQSSGEDSPRSNKYNESHTSKKKQKSLSKEPSEESLPEKKHTPLFIKRTPDKYDSSGLISWDPYRAADDTALISLPGQEMNNLTSKPPAQEKVTTTTFTELSLPGSLRPNFYTTEPGEPIVITSDALSPGSNHVSQRQSSSSRRNSNSLNVRVPNNGHMQQQQQQTTYHNPSYNSREEGMSTFQEIPHSKSHLETYGRNSGNNGDYVILSEFDNEEPVAKNLNDNDLKVPNHISPRSSQLPNQDVADVISQSVRPGANPQPLINSLREELLSLSSKKLSPSSSSSSGVTTSINVPNGRNKTAPAFTVNGYGGKGYYSSGSASSGWESMPK